MICWEVICSGLALFGVLREYRLVAFGGVEFCLFQNTFEAGWLRFSMHVHARQFKKIGSWVSLCVLFLSLMFTFRLVSVNTLFLFNNGAWDKVLGFTKFADLRGDAFMSIRVFDKAA